MSDKVLITALVLIIGIIVIAVAIYKSISKPSKPPEPKIRMGGDFPKVEEKEKPAITAGAGLIHTLTDWSEPVKTPEPAKKTVPEEHVIDKLYLFAVRRDLWICPNCECENGTDRVKCCVCNKSKDEWR